MKKIISFTLLILFMVVPVCAQSVSVSAKIDSTQIKIGQQTLLKIQAIVNAGQRVVFPSFKDTIVSNVFVVSSAKPDTQKVENNRLQITKAYTVTSFDSALYYLPPLVVQVDKQNYQTGALALKVQTVPVDTLHPEKFYGEKAIMNPPFVWADWIGMIICSIIVLLVIAALIYFIVRLHDNKPIIRRIKIAPKLSPHQIAMKELEEIKAEKLSLKKESPKEYYTKLTETIRNYIKERFGFNAMEMTSQEIIDKLTEMKDDSALSDLRILFQTSDLVKFAKHAPELNENDANLLKAVDFVNQTKNAEEENLNPQPTEITVVEKRSLRTKRILVLCIVLLSLAGVGCLIYIGLQLYELLP
jgi:hypothetical protein